jgi:hypothetical protein
MSSRAPPPEWKDEAADCLRMRDGSKSRLSSSMVGCQSSGFKRSLDLPNLVLRMMNQMMRMPAIDAPRPIITLRAPADNDAAPKMGGVSDVVLVLAGAPTTAVWVIVNFTSLGIDVSVDDGSGVADAGALVEAEEEIWVEDAEMTEDEPESKAEEDKSVRKDEEDEEDDKPSASLILARGSEGADDVGVGLELGAIVE